MKAIVSRATSALSAHTPRLVAPPCAGCWRSLRPVKPATHSDHSLKTPLNIQTVASSPGTYSWSMRFGASASSHSA